MVESRVNFWPQRSGQLLTMFIGCGLGTATLGPPHPNTQRLLVGIWVLGMVVLLILGLTVFRDIDVWDDLMSACEAWKVRTLDCTHVNAY